MFIIYAFFPLILVYVAIVLKPFILSSDIVSSLFGQSFNHNSFQTPLISLKNGTVTGKYLQGFNQDLYLGIPFAEPPIGSLRFLPPQPYGSSWTGIKQFKEYGYACHATIGSDSLNLPQSEDCLTLNVVKPHGNNRNQSLPVAIWIHGGGFTDGSATRPAYNLSYIVQNSEAINVPFIGVSLNYRLNGFGFINSNEIAARGYTNLGLRDQIQAIKWVHENIAAFGGDPNHLVLWGESAGGISVGKLLSSTHLGDYIKGGILQSGNHVFPNIKKGVTEEHQNDFKKLVAHFKCEDPEDQIQCLQEVDERKLKHVFHPDNGILDKGFKYPYVDNDIIERSSFEILESGSDFLKVPLLIGTTTDEGTVFVNTSIDTFDLARSDLLSTFSSLNNVVATKLLELYPVGNLENSAPNDPTYNRTRIVYPASFGSRFPSLSCLHGDLKFLAGARITSRKYSEQGVPVFKYRHNIPSLKTSDTPFLGTTHYQEVVYVFDNKQHPTNSSDGTNVLSVPDARIIAETMSKLWASFITDLDPNLDQSLLPFDTPFWPEYKNGTKNLVFDLKGFHLETDDAREVQYEYIETILEYLDV